MIKLRHRGKSRRTKYYEQETSTVVDKFNHRLCSFLGWKIPYEAYLNKM